MASVWISEVGVWVWVEVMDAPPFRSVFYMGGKEGREGRLRGSSII